MANLGFDLDSIFDGLYSWLSFVPRISLTNIIEIIIIAFLVYTLLVWIKNTKAWDLLKGILVIILFSIIAAFFNLDIILWILENTATIAVTALIIIFQPELRKALEQLGSNNLISEILDTKINEGFSKETADELVRATFEMAKVKTGALIVIEKEISLGDIGNTGIAIEGVVSSQLLINIFEHNTPLHDGAVVIKGNRIIAATCYLPLTESNHVSKELGTRHRAALGISEVTDSVTIVVSEETGRVSLVEGGILRRLSDAETLRKALYAIGIKPKVENKRFKIWKGKGKNEEKAD